MSALDLLLIMYVSVAWLLFLASYRALIRLTDDPTTIWVCSIILMLVCLTWFASIPALMIVYYTNKRKGA